MARSSSLYPSCKPVTRLCSTSNRPTVAFVNSRPYCSDGMEIAEYNKHSESKPISWWQIFCKSESKPISQWKIFWKSESKPTRLRQFFWKSVDRWRIQWPHQPKRVIGNSTHKNGSKNSWHHQLKSVCWVLKIKMQHTKLLFSSTRTVAGLDSNPATNNA